MTVVGAKPPVDGRRTKVHVRPQRARAALFGRNRPRWASAMKRHAFRRKVAASDLMSIRNHRTMATFEATRFHHRLTKLAYRFSSQIRAKGSISNGCKKSAR